MPDLIKQPDTYHAIAHVLGVIDKKSDFEESKILRLMKRYEENQRKAQERIEIYNSFHYLYISILKELEIFDDTGKLAS